MFLQTLAVPCQFRPSQAQTIGLRVRSHSPREPSLRAGVMRSRRVKRGSLVRRGLRRSRTTSGSELRRGKVGTGDLRGRGDREEKSAARIQEAADMHRITGKAGGDSLIEMSPTDSFNGE